MLQMDLVRPNPQQPRQRFDETSLQRLADSIRTAGLMQPIVVRPTASGFEIVAGERRWRAFQKLGKPEIPAIVRAVDNQTAAEWALVENLQREDLDPMERADGVARLMEEFGLSQSAVGTQLGLDRSTVANLLRLRDADPSLREALITGLLTQGHAKALLGVTDLKRRGELLEDCVRDGWSVREVERRVQAAIREPVIRPAVGAGPPRSAHVADLEKRLGTHLGTKVGITLGRQKGRGKMVIEFYSLQQFDGLLEKIGFDAQADG
jgi:ParB family chromosome partitioning protein